MYKVLIVDDEALIRKSIEYSIDFENLPLELCGQAKNGLEASELIISQGPDIVITDIKMPVMSGIDLINELKENNIQKKVIVVSGYDDYDFVREALTYGSIDYITKPIDPDELNAALITAIKELDHEQEANERHKHIEAQLKRHKPYLMEQFVSHLALSRLNSEREVAQSVEFFGLLEFFPAFVCCAFSCQEAFHMPAQEFSYFLISLRDLFADEFGMGNIVFFENTHNELFCLVSVPGTQPEESIMEELAGKARCALRFISDANNTKISISISNMHHAVHEVAEAYTEASNAARDSFHNADDPVRLYMDVFSNHTQTQVSLIEIEKGILLQIAGSSLKEATQSTELFYQLLFHSDRFHNHSQHLALNRFLLHLEEFIRESGIDNKKLADMLVEAKNKASTTDCSAVSQDSLVALVTEIISKVNHDRTSKYKEIISKVLDYMNRHFASDISLSDAASQVHLTPSYLSALFRQYYGKSFMQCLTEIRIKKAKELLVTDMKVHEISDQCGFSNSKYFNKIFKKVAGCTPTEYRAART
ncbi:response regulator [Christensenellaceae bacterium OttesenSCG-928-K19]|nr:response regulator [Christensenellaceae bacterium OttesenSCG-928-K19]